MKILGCGIPMDDGTVIKINAAAYSDDLILYSEPHHDTATMLALLAAFSEYAKVMVNAEKCVWSSQVWSSRSKSEQDPGPFYIHTDLGDKEIPMEIVSIYLGMPIGFNKSENTKHGE
jgi:hypothetical protein